MQSNAVVLAKNVASTAPTAAVNVDTGGRYNLVVLATTYPTTCQLQVLGPDAATWIPLGSSLSANGVASFDLAAGQYRMNLNTGTTAGLYATLVRVPY